MATEPNQLAAALEAQDAVAVAFAIRNGPVFAPKVDDDDPPAVRVFPRRDTGGFLLLLFSSPESYKYTAPQLDDENFMELDAVSLREYLEENGSAFESVFFDVAGPHPMQADPQDLLDALLLDSH